MRGLNWLPVYFLCSLALSTRAQETAGKILSDKRNGCKVWYKYYASEDSVTWSGKCSNNWSEGPGVLTGFTRGVQTSVYEGEMKQGKPHGNGSFTFADGRKLSGNFSHGEILNLNKPYLKQLNKHVISDSDSMVLYVGDNNQQELYYHALVPEGKLKGALVLMPGTWETTEHVISSTQALCERAFDQQLAVFVLSINQRLTLTDEVLLLMNRMLSDAKKRYQIADTQFVMGGWSMGGLFSLRYTQISRQDPARTIIHPAAVFSCDGPSDLENIYNMFKRKLKKSPHSGEPQYGIRELESYCGGSPDVAREKYMQHSTYSFSHSLGGNTQYLANVPVRVYCDVDPVWWMNNRGVDMYDMNALDQTAMIQLLNEMGNKQAEFINAFGKGYRIEGNRHPHSWSIVEPEDCLRWILRNL